MEVRECLLSSNAELFANLLSKNIQIKIHKTKIFSVVLFGCEAWSLTLTFRHRASSILGQAFRYSPENAFYIFNQQIYFIM